MKFSNTHLEILFVVGNTSFVTVHRNMSAKMAFPDGRKQHSFLYTRSGCMQYKSLARSFDNITAPESTLVFIPKGTQHASVYTEDNTQVEIAQFEIISGELPDYLSMPVIIEINNANELFSSFRADFEAGIGDNPLYFLYRIYELLWNVSIQQPKIPYKFKKLQKVVQEIMLRYYENRKIADYAEMSGMSESGFRRLFHEYTGCSPVEYRNEIRLKEAQKLLRSGEYCVEETAHIVGFSNLHFFSRSYKKCFGYSPSKEC